MQDALEVNEWLTEQKPKHVVQVGAGYVGLEMADALTRRGIKVTLVEVAPQVLQTLDPDLAGMVSDILSKQGVEVVTGTGVESISKKEGKFLVSGSGNFSQATDMVIVAAGGTPRISLALAAGASTGMAGAIQVDRRMETKVPDVFAAGDCTETWHRVLEKNVYLPLGTSAHKQGRIAGENALGGDRQFQGTLGTQVVKVFDRVVARTGLRDREAREAGFDPVSVDTESWDHKQYYPGARKMYIRLTGDRGSGRFLGAQMIGYHGSEVSKRVDVCAAALYHGMKVEEFNDLDLSYTPPLSSPWDPVQMAAQAWVKKSR
jgi:NADPH-dependent 2,4-dienoyl-CoA reductase/sulfur reductase-like enzyme